MTCRTWRARRDARRACRACRAVLPDKRDTARYDFFLCIISWATPSVSCRDVPSGLWALAYRIRGRRVFRVTVTCNV